jgi:acyl-CoA dehydrogenase
VQLILTEDQELLSKTAADFVAERSPVSRVRELRDSKDPAGFSRELWKEMASLGWVGITLPESVGGAGMGFAELAVVMERLGRALAPEPFLSTVLLGAEALRLGGSEEQKAHWLPRVVEGDALLTVAHQEPGARFDLARVATLAEPRGSGFTLRGEKVAVLDGTVADAIVIPARTSGGEHDREGISLFLVPAAAAGLRVESQSRIDSRGAARLRLEGVEVGADAIVGELDRGGVLLEAVVDHATLGLCAEMLGSMCEIFERTVEGLVSLAKARCSDAGMLVANEALQMHGGVGMTDEYEIGFFLKRARVAELTFGDAAWHRDRWARLAGY